MQNPIRILIKIIYHGLPVVAIGLQVAEIGDREGVLTLGYGIKNLLYYWNQLTEPIFNIVGDIIVSLMGFPYWSVEPEEADLFVLGGIFSASVFYTISGRVVENDLSASLRELYMFYTRSMYFLFVCTILFIISYVMFSSVLEVVGPVSNIGPIFPIFLIVMLFVLVFMIYKRGEIVGRVNGLLDVWRVFRGIILSFLLLTALSFSPLLDIGSYPASFA